MAMLLCLCSLTAAAALPAPAPAAAVTPIHIAMNSTQLFVDDFLVASKTANLVRSLHRPDCSRVVVTTDAPWERNYTMGLIGTNVILREDGTLQLTYCLRNSTLAGVQASECETKRQRPATVQRNQPHESTPAELRGDSWEHLHRLRRVDRRRPDVPEAAAA
jgi:hypothetical protein